MCDCIWLYGGREGGTGVCGRNDRWPYLPRLAEAAHSCGVQAHDDGEEAVEIPQSLAALNGKSSRGHLFYTHIDCSVEISPPEGAAATVKCAD